MTHFFVALTTAIVNVNGMRLVKIPVQTPQKPRRRKTVGLFVVVLVIASLGVQLLRPLPHPTLQISQPGLVVLQGSEPTLDWPTEPGMQSALGAEGFGVLATNGDQRPIATASIAKVITALCVLQKHPLKVGEQGPVLTMDETDYNLYRTTIANDGSNIPVYIGQEMTLYQGIQALMIPSANNIADSLAIWAFGSLEEYQKYASNFVAKAGMNSTVIGSDASGLDVATRSTATDLIKLGLLAQKNPVIMEIAGQKQADFPGAMQIANYNKTLGEEGITGLKTGNNSENPGGLLFTQERLVAGKKLQVVGVVLGAQDLPEALRYATKLARTTPQAFELFSIQQSTVGTAKTAWGGETSIRTADKRSFLRYKSQPVKRTYTFHAPNEIKKGTILGRMIYQSGVKEFGTDLEAAADIPDPSLKWRLTRPL